MAPITLALRNLSMRCSRLTPPRCAGRGGARPVQPQPARSLAATAGRGTTAMGASATGRTTARTSARRLSARHEFGTATHRLPLDRDIARRYLERLNVDPDEWEDLMDENEEDEEGRGVRYSHLHHHPADRRLTAGGRATVDLSSRTNFRDDQRDLRAHGSPPQPSRPRGGQTGVEESPSKRHAGGGGGEASGRRRSA